MKSGTQCTCSALSAIAGKITLFESDVSLIVDVEKKLALVSAAIKQLGMFIQGGELCAVNYYLVHNVKVIA